MRTTSVFCVLFILLLISCRQSDQDMDLAWLNSKYDTTDKRMMKAIANARENVYDFGAAHITKGINSYNFGMKIRIGDSTIWLQNITEGKMNEYSGQRTKNGPIIKINKDDICDWMYLVEGNLIGGYTIRVQYDHMNTTKMMKIQKMGIKITEKIREYD